MYLPAVELRGRGEVLGVDPVRTMNLFGLDGKSGGANGQGTGDGERGGVIYSFETCKPGMKENR